MSVTISEPFVVGEIPAPLQYNFLDASGEPIDLSGFAAKFSLRERNGAASTYNATVTSPTVGEVTYQWTGAEFATSGHYRAEFWVGNGIHRYASVDILFDVAVSVGPVPQI